MKKALLSSLIFLIFTLSVCAYETIIIKYPDGERWEKAYYKKLGNEALLQYVPYGYSQKDWVRSIFVHSYEFSQYRVSDFMDSNLAMLLRVNPTAKYKYLKYTDNDIIAQRCTKDYKEIKAQCEFYRVTRAHDGLISVHYINRDKADFIRNFKQWYDIIKKAKFYNTYYRDDRTLDKSEYFEL